MKWFRKRKIKKTSDCVIQSEVDNRHIPEKARFDNVLSLAATLSSAARHNLLRALVRPIQSDYLLAVGSEGQDARPTLDARHFFFESLYDYISFKQLSLQEIPSENYPLSLASDMVLPWPWSMNSYKGCMNIGSRQGNPWHFDGSNHMVELCLLWRIAFVKGGNHSLVAGILSGEGLLLPERVFNMQDLLNRVSTNGVEWFGDGRPVEKVRDWRTAAVYELGRLVS